MAIALIAHTAQASSGGGSLTTSAIDTSGANFLVMATSGFTGVNPVGVPTDSKSNTWIGLTVHTNSVTNTVPSQIFYAVNPTVGTGHTFSFGAASTFPSICVAAFSGVATTSPFDTVAGEGAGDNGTAITLSISSITPNQANSLVIAVDAIVSGDTSSVDGGFTITDDIPPSGGNCQGSALAYLIQTTAAAAAPTFTLVTVADRACGGSAVFKPSTGGGATPGTPFFYRHLSGGGSL
jgi:hypothetical protein